VANRFDGVFPFILWDINIYFFFNFLVPEMVFLFLFSSASFRCRITDNI
jgi:hypothetical protein